MLAQTTAKAKTQNPMTATTKTTAKADPVALSHNLLQSDVKAIAKKLLEADLIGTDQEEDIYSHLWETIDWYTGEYSRR